MIKEKKSPVKLTVETTDLETKMILQALTYRHVESEKIPKSWKRLTVILRWPDLGDGLAPDNVTFYFQNGVAVTFHFAGHIICYCPPFNTEDPERFLDEMCSLKYDEIVSGWKDITAEANRWNMEPIRGVLRLDGGLVDPFGGSHVPITYRHGAATVSRWLKDTCTRMAGTRPIELGCGSFPRGTAERWQRGADQKVTDMAEWKVLN